MIIENAYTLVSTIFATCCQAVVNIVYLFHAGSYELLTIYRITWNVDWLHRYPFPKSQCWYWCKDSKVCQIQFPINFFSFCKYCDCACKLFLFEQWFQNIFFFLDKDYDNLNGDFFFLLSLFYKLDK